MRSKILITIGIFFSVLILLVIGAFFFTQTEYFRTLVRRTAESIVSSSTGQTFSIGKLEGNFFYNIKLEDVSFRVENENFVSVKEISVNYSLPQMLDGTMLFSKVVPVDKISISGVDVNLVKYGDGSWNFGKIGSGKDKDKKKDEEEKPPPDWSVILSDLLLKDAEITLDDRESKKVSKYLIHETDLSAKLINITEKMEIDLRNADFDAPSEDISVMGLSTKAMYTGDTAEIDNFRVLFNEAEIKLEAQAENLKNNPKVSFNASAHDYVLKDIGTFNLETEGEGEFVSPKDIRAEMSVKIPESEVYGKKLTGSLAKITMSGTRVELGEGDIKTELGDVLLSGNADLSRLIAKEGSNSFSLKLSLKDVKTTEIFTLLEEKADTKTEAIYTQLGAVLNASLEAEGSWVEFGDLTAKGKIENLEIKGKEAGDLKLTGDIDYSKSALGMDIKSSLQKVDLGTILSNENLTSDITSDLNIKGTIPLEGDIIQQTSVSVIGEISPSSIFNLNLKEGDIDVTYEKELLDVKTLSLKGDSFNFNVENGSVGTKGMDLGYKLEVGDLGLISAFVSDTEFSGSLKAEGEVTGEIKKPKVTIEALASDIAVNEDFAAESVKIDGEGVIDLENPELRAEINAVNAMIKGKEFSSIVLDADSEGKAINLNAKIIENDQFNYEINTTLADLSSEEKNIEISSIKLNLEDTKLANREKIAITVAPKRLVVDSFNLYYNDTSVIADARIHYDGTLDTDLKLSNLNLDDVTKALEFATPVQGAISANINVMGTMEVPQINANITTRDLAYQEFKNDYVSLDLSYLNRNMNLKFLITNNNATVMQAQGNANVDLNFKELGENIKDATFNLTVSSSGVDLSPLASISEEIEKSEGMLVVDLKASGSVEDPSVNGQLSLKDAVFKIQSLGNELDITNAQIEMQGKKGILRQLEIASGKNGGGATFEGEIDLATLAYNLKGNMNNFLIKPQRISANLSGDIDVKGQGNKIEAAGNITLLKSRITIPEEEEKQIEEIKFTDEDKDEFAVGNGDEEDFFKDNVALDLQVRMRRNNWVKGRGANIELKGNLDIDKEFGEEVRITGDINTVRGTYETLGKLFRIEQGRVSFSGAPEINPNLDITALYRVSDVQIYINITGTGKAPEIKLTSDPPMQETDIVSYLVFGAPSDQISSGDRSAISGVATGIAGGIAAAQLERLLGDRLSPDVLSVAGGTNGPQIEVGKYVTRDLYIAYERGTTESILDSTNITTNRILLEYTIFDSVSIDADVGGENPGADLFYNFNY